MARARVWVTRLDLLEKERGSRGQRLHTIAKKFQTKAKIWMNHLLIFYDQSGIDRQIYIRSKKRQRRGKDWKVILKKRLQLSQTEEKSLQHRPQHNDHVWNSSVYLQCTESPISPQNDSMTHHQHFQNSRIYLKSLFHVFTGHLANVVFRGGH